MRATAVHGRDAEMGNISAAVTGRLVGVDVLRTVIPMAMPKGMQLQRFMLRICPWHGIPYSADLCIMEETSCEANTSGTNQIADAH